MDLFAFYFLLALPVELSLDLQCSCTASLLPTINCAVLQYLFHLPKQGQERHQEVNFHSTAGSELHPTRVKGV